MKLWRKADMPNIIRSVFSEKEKDNWIKIKKEVRENN